MRPFIKKDSPAGRCSWFDGRALAAIVHAMCNRYTAAQREAIRLYGKEILPTLLLEEDWNPIYNIPPTSRVPVIVNDTDRPGRLLSWGTQTTHGLVMNARSETLHEKPLWKDASENRRCVMLADGFFEWETIGKKKLGHYLSLHARRPFAIAGVWFTANDDQPERVVMVTCEPNSLVQPFHDRMPAVLTTDAAKEWLGLKALAPEAIARLCQPYPVKLMNHWRSPPEMNSVTFQDGKAIEPWVPEPDLFG
jgi:putative SOS response-associated peptidase YedK